MADLSTVVPDGTGTFLQFDETPSISGQSIAFRGFTADGLGVYGEFGGALVRIADRNTTVPGRAVTFGGFTNPVDISGEAVAFSAAPGSLPPTSPGSS